MIGTGCSADLTFGGGGAVFTAVTSSYIAGAPVSAATYYSGSTRLSGLFAARGSLITPGVYAMEADRSRFDVGTVTPCETTPKSYAQYTSAGAVLANAVSTKSDTPRPQASYRSAASIMGRR